MAKRLKQRIRIGNEVRWVTGASVQELLENAIKTATEHCAATHSPTATSACLFSNYAANWMKTYKVNCLKHTTLREYSAILNCHLLPVFGERDIRTITTDNVQQLMNERTSLSRKSIREIIMILGMIMESAVEDGLISRNPARSKRLRNPSNKKNVRNALTREQIADILQHLPFLSEERDRLMLALLLFTGMRRNEVLGLRWADVNMNQQMITVSRGVTYKGNQPVISTPKTAAGIRQIPIPTALCQWLIPRHENLYVIGGQSTPITETTFKRMWERISKSIDLYGATPHVFRHTYMTFAQRAQLSTKTLQTIGGYADLATLQNRYSHTQLEDIEAARKALDSLFCDTSVTEKIPQPLEK